MELREAVDRVRCERLNIEELRATVLVEGLFAPGEVRLVHGESERTIIGSAVTGASALTLPAPEAIGAESSTDRRELGVANLGGPGRVSVGSTRHSLGPRDLQGVTLERIR